MFDAGAVVGAVKLKLEEWRRGTREVLDDQAAMKQGLGRLGSAAETASRKLRTIGLAATAVQGYIAKAAWDWERATGIIVKGTGAAGKALDGLRDDLRAVLARGVPQSMDVVAQVLADLNTRLGLTGQALQAVTQVTLDFARVNNVDAASAVRNIGRLMNSLGRDISEIPFLLDKLTKAAQDTGVSADRLVSLIVEAGPAFEELGFGLDKSIALFAQFEKYGARPEELLSSMNILLNRLAESGVGNAEKAFKELLERIRNAPSLLAATSVAAEAFGARVGGKIADDIRAGRFEVDAYVDVLEGSKGALAEAAWASLTFGDRLGVVSNKAKAALKPLSDVVSELARGVVPYLGAAVDLLGKAADGFAKLPPFITHTTMALLSMGAAVKAVNVALAIMGLKITLLSGWGAVIAALTVVLASSAVMLTAYWHRSKEVFMEYVADVMRGVADIIETIERFKRWSTFAVPRAAAGAAGVAERTLERLGLSEAARDWLRDVQEEQKYHEDRYTSGGERLARRLREWAKKADESSRKAMYKSWEEYDLSILDRIKKRLGIGEDTLDIDDILKGLGVKGGLDEFSKQFDAAVAGLGKGDKEMERLREQGKALYLQLFEVAGILQRVKDGLDSLSAADLLTDDTRWALGREVWSELEGKSRETVLAVIAGLEGLDAKVAESVKHFRELALQARATEIIEDIQPSHVKAFRELRDALDTLKDAGRMDADVENLLAANYWDALSRDVRAAADAFPELVSAIDAAVAAKAREAGEQLFGELSGQTALAKAREELTQLAPLLQEAIEAGTVTDEERNILGAALWGRWRDLAPAAVDELVARLHELDPVAAKAAEEIRTAKESLDELGASVADMGYKLNQVADTIDSGLGRKLGAAVTGVGSLVSSLSKAKEAFKALRESGQSSATGVLSSVVQMGSGVLGAVGAVATLAESFGLFGKKAEKELKGIDRVLDEIGKKVDEWADRLTDAIVEFVKTGKAGFKEFVESVLEDLLRLTIRYAVVGPIFDALKGAFAKGGVFARGEVLAFARGGVVKAPTVFPMAKGNVGLMGEAGPEAILPLRRMPGGDLGVTAAGGGVEVNIIDQRGANAPNIEVEERQGPDGRRQLQILVRDVFAEDVRTGWYDRLLSQRFGMQPQGVAR